jgi:3-isopropylmalate/(R)-2-methylmalate dehydratase small subunit
MKAVREIRSRTVVVAQDDVDTDQIIPARYLLTTSRQGLAQALFADWRFDPRGDPRLEFALNQPEAAGARVLVAGRNFGCGSSREHAVWALQAYGFEAVLSSSFADIFRANALKNGLLPVVVEPEVHARLLRSPGTEVAIDLAAGSVIGEDWRGELRLEAFARHCLINGIDDLSFLFSHANSIAAFEAAAGLTPWRLS